MDISHGIPFASPMKTYATVEKHVPVYTVEGSHVHVVIGETKHPMLEEHFI